MQPLAAVALCCGSAVFATWEWFCVAGSLRSVCIPPCEVAMSCRTAEMSRSWAARLLALARGVVAGRGAGMGALGVTGLMASRWVQGPGWPGSNLTSIVVLIRAVTVAPPRGDGMAGWSSFASRECGVAEGRPPAGGAQACADDLRNSCRRDWMPSLRYTLRRW